MDVEKLIDRLKNYSIKDKALLNLQTVKVAAEALTTLQAELEKVKAERDAYKIYFDDLSSKPDCNTCGDRDCPYMPRVGDTVRVNCPLWREQKEE